MSAKERWLVTGVSGYIGGALIEPLSQKKDVVGMTRKRTSLPVPVVQGDFASFEDLRQLDQYQIDGVVHLAAATGGSTEEDALSINVQGTRRLVRYLLDRGCRKFVLASSIAAVGCLDAGFLPNEFPISDDHPGMARDAYGFSKALMEELSHYFFRVHEDADFINLRFGAVLGPRAFPEKFANDSHIDNPSVELARVHLQNVLDSILAAVDAPRQEGVRVYNVVDPHSYCTGSVTDIMRAFYGERLEKYDLSAFETSGREQDPIYAIDKIQRELGVALKDY